ncbi:hypothetical protein [Legionella sp. km772]|uniref:hypothetical protein n=1 Tax=Legionella sp. km772 TaxID=2498111 RepID=UPI000F8DE061|nr:hypothetical protein [Legionella sp. km772]RUR04216.1 hypothetical protein ELY15_15785 [Legionella sp. km772]
MKKNWGKRILLVIGLILVLLLIINLLLTYTLNYILGKQIIPKINNEQRQLSLISSVSIFPSATININNLSYYQDKKSLITIEQLSMQVDFWKLFKGKLYINKISINQARLNLYNIPSLTWKKSTRPYRGMKEQTPSQHS